VNNRIEVTSELSPKEISDLLQAFPRGCVAFDLEMTGLSPILDKIIEIAAVKVDKNGNVTYFHELVNPLIPIPEHTIQYHNITNDMVRDARTLKKPLQEFIEFYGDLPLIAHNAQFDAGYLVRAHHQFNFDFTLSDVYDSVKLTRILFKNAPDNNRPKSFKLSDLAEHYDINFNHHQAMDDAIVCMKVFSNCINRMTCNNQMNLLKDFGYIFKMNSFKKPADYELPKKFELLREVVPKQTPIEIEYKGGSIQGLRPVRPIALLPMPQGLVLFAECLKDNMNKHFLIKKIRALQAIENK
jgi:DNA polymerase-3 subunit epsilon